MHRRIVMGALVALLTLPLTGIATETTDGMILPPLMVVRGGVKIGTPTLDVRIDVRRMPKATVTVSVFVNEKWEEDVEILAPSTWHGPTSVFETTVDLVSLDLHSGDRILLVGTVTDGRTTLTCKKSVKVKGHRRDVVIVPPPIVTVP